MATSMLRLDPSRTTLLRKKFVAEMNKRFRALKGDVLRLLVEQDVLGVIQQRPKSPKDLLGNVSEERAAWRFLTSEKKLAAFSEWLSQRIDERILEVTDEGLPWTSPYIHSAYRKGAMRSYQALHPKGMTEKVPLYKARRGAFLETAFLQPERLGKVEFLSTRTFEELKGISAAMSQQMNRIFAEGIAHGSHPYTIAKALNENIDKINKTRAHVLARTEIIHAHAEGQLDAFEDIGVEEVGLMAEWSTTEDGAVCPLCKPLDGVVLKVEEARGLLPRHPNCRCAWVPAVESVPQPGQVWDPVERKSRMRRSIHAERPSRMFRENLSRSTWRGKEVLKKQIREVPKTRTRSTSTRKSMPKPKDAAGLTQHVLEEVTALAGKDYGLLVASEKVWNSRRTMEKLFKERVALERKLGAKGIMGDALQKEAEWRALTRAIESLDMEMKDLRKKWGNDVINRSLLGKKTLGKKRRQAWKIIEDAVADKATPIDFRFHFRASDEEKELFDKVAKVMGGWWGESLKRKYIGVSSLGPNERSHISGTTIHIAMDAFKKNPSVVVHEVGHIIERKRGDIQRKMKAFLAARTRGEQARSLRRMFPNAGYNSSELAKVDRFPHPYCGRIYRDGETEILSMGMHFLWLDPVGFAVKDPEYFTMLIRTMLEARGVR